MRFLATAILLALVVCAPAAALAPGTTTLIDRPSGLGALPPSPMTDQQGSLNASMTPDGRYVAFVSGADGLSDSDDNRRISVWRRDRQTQTLLHVQALHTYGGDDVVDISDDGNRICFETYERLTGADTDDSGDIYVRDVTAGTVTLASPNNTSSWPAMDCAISGDGNHVVFTTATSLDAADTDGVFNDVYRYTLATQAVALVSRADTAAGAIGNNHSQFPDINFDGDSVAFTTTSTNLDPPDANGGTHDVMVRKLSTHDTRVVSTAHGSPDAEGNGVSVQSAISGDGDYVAFESMATNLVGADDTASDYDVFRKRLSTNQTILVSRADGAAGAKSTAQDRHPVISASGTSVAWMAGTTSLTSDPGEATVRRDLDGVAPQTRLASRAAGAGGVSGEGRNLPASVTDGGLVTFMSNGRNLSTAGDVDFEQLYVRDVVADTLEPLLRPSGAAPATFPGGQNRADLEQSVRGMSDDGRYVVFGSSADSLSDEDDDRIHNGFVRDVLTGQTTFVTRADGAAGAPANGNVFELSISADGRRVAFSTFATNLGGDATALRRKVYVRDLVANTTVLASRADGPSGAPAAGHSQRPVLDGDGSRVAFVTTAANLGDGDTDTVVDVHVRDLVTGQTLLASRADGPNGAKGASFSEDPYMDASGNRVAFYTNNANYGNGDTDNSADIHVRDLATGQTLWASRPDGTGTTQTDFSSDEPSLSADGTRVAFVSASTNLGDGDTDSDSDLHVRDLVANTTTLASRADGASGAPGNANSFTGVLSADGTAVAFASNATNLAPGDTNGASDIFLRRLDTNETTLVSRGDGTNGALLEAGGITDSPRVNADGSCVAFRAENTEALLPAGASPDFAHVLLRTLRRECPLPAGGGNNNTGNNNTGNNNNNNTNTGGGGTKTETPSAPATPAPPVAAPPLRPIVRPPLPVLPALSAARVLKLPTACTSRRRFRIKLALPAGARVASVSATINRKRAKTTRRGAAVDLRGLPKGRITVKITVKLADGRSVTTTRRYRTCAPRGKRG